MNTFLIQTLPSILGGVVGHSLIVFTALTILNKIRISKGKKYEPTPYIILGLVISTINLSAVSLVIQKLSEIHLLAYVIVNILMVIILTNKKKRVDKSR